MGKCAPSWLVAATLVVCSALTPPALGAQVQKPGNPEDHLPANIQHLTYFGERPSWSPDGRQIAFMEKSFGDAFVVDLKSGQIRLLTHFPHAGFLRVQYLPNGDFLLVGARKFEDVRKTRFSDQELWYLRNETGARPVAFEQKLTEGVAISRSRMRIAWATDRRTHPEQKDGVIYTADVVMDGAVPKLANKREAVRLNTADCVGGEPQDFRNNDRELIYVCYRLRQGVIMADVLGVDLETGKSTTFRKLENEYNEVEGVTPDGRYAMVESSRDQPTQSSKTIDVWRLKLEPNSSDMVRLTRWGDHPGYKASNPVVSPDGRMMAFQSGRGGDESGVGYGVFVMKLK